jgi:ABC-type amino acid transport substrate-binding protein
MNRRLDQVRKEECMITTRRSIVAGALIFASLAISPHLQAQDKPTEIRIGTQKGGFFPAVRQRHTVEDTFRPLGIEIKWVDFQFGPPLLEAINVGAVDFGFVGDSPPIFAQAGGARIRYVAAVKSDGNNQAIIVPKDSAIKTIADLKGKRVAFGKGSSAHNLLVAALEKAGLSYGDISPAPLAPADATAAFLKGSVDAWSIWDPYLALAELKENVTGHRFRQGRPQAQCVLHRGIGLCGEASGAGGEAQRRLCLGGTVGGQPSRGGGEGASRGDRCRYRRGQTLRLSLELPRRACR